MINLILFGLVCAAPLLDHFFGHPLPSGTTLAFGPLAAIAAPLLVGAGGAVASKLLGGGKSTTIDQVPLETPEQAQARKMLLEFTQTGQLGPTAAGGAYTGPLGDFSPTGTESAALGKLSSYVNNSGTPGIFTAGQSALNDLLTTDKYNPLVPGGAYDAFKTETQHNLDLATGDLKNKLAFSGGLYSTNTGKQVGNLETQANQALTSKLGDLYQNYINQKLSGIPQAASFAQTGQSLELNPITAGLSLGSLPRELNTASDQASLSQYLQQHSELLNAAGTVAGQNTQFGVPSLTVPSASPWTSTVNAATSTGVQELIRQLYAQPTTTAPKK